MAFFVKKHYFYIMTHVSFCLFLLIIILSYDIIIVGIFQIIKFAIDSQIIDIDEVKVYLELEKDELTVKVFDKEIFDKEMKIKFHGNVKDFDVKLKKMVKLFN